MNLLILSRIYFYLFWALWVVFLLTLQTTVWPFIFGGISPPNLFLNGLILISLMTQKPSLGPYLLGTLFLGATSSMAFGYYLVPAFAIYLAFAFIRTQTFILSEKSLFWVLVGAHVSFIVVQETFFILWAHSYVEFPFFDLVISVALSTLAFPIQRHCFKLFLYWWRSTRWGELGYE